MKRPVEVYRKKTKLLLIALFSITFGCLGIWSGISKYDVLSVDFALRSIGEIILDEKYIDKSKVKIITEE